MFGKKKPEVLVVGAGPVGLFSALLLAKRGIRVEIIDRDWRTGAHSYALALHPSSLRLFHDLGLLTDVLDQAYLVQTIGVYDASERQAELRAPESSEYGCLVAVLQQDALESLLENSLDSLGVKVLWNHELSGLESYRDGVRTTIDHLVKETVGYAVAHTEWTVGKTIRLDLPFVIGADGHRSTVRRRMGIDFEPAGEAQHFAVFECETNADLGHEMKVVFAHNTTNVLWPMHDGRCRWSFQLLDYRAPEGTRTKDRIAVELGTGHYPMLSPESFEGFLNDRAPWFDATVEKINWRIVVRFEHRLAGSFGKNRVWLAGDAGHVTGPVGMQSMNVGLAEAHELTGIIGGILREDKPSDQLKEYSDRRIEEWQNLLGLKGTFHADETASPWIRQHGDQLLPCLPASGSGLRDLAAQLCLQPS
jgi:2-polyprenyl-6-methoxyphenol hydroxylase-like FAD-dependent oxidoreductase